MSGRRAAGRRAETVATGANLGGIGLGPLCAGLLAQFLQDPLILLYVIFGPMALVLALAASLAPETAGMEERPQYRDAAHLLAGRGPSSLPGRGHRAVIAFAVFGMFTSLAPSFLAGTLGYRWPGSPGRPRLRCLPPAP